MRQICGASFFWLSPKLLPLDNTNINYIILYCSRLIVSLVITEVTSARQYKYKLYYFVLFSLNRIFAYRN